ncbi:hypothetical protein [Allomuricauda sp. SCSIO 65647]|uniref:hypothetical protein n=1 Tax=Allomuricauda sp. SCSIO 65647 TaxID=2908843 RepID=UPI001F33F853|nr:hypothetical protein [Muricauda sp. SCSIO 65647]UJH66882.1 hypothetical protein L0P89_13070 [Muricauda sp. SCSIO 65647]
MKKTIALIAFLVATNLSAQIDRDKALHFLGGNLFGLAGAGIAKQASDGNRYWTFAGAVGGSLAIGLAKEAVDAGQRENGWDNEDLLATVLGGMTVGFTIDIFTDRKRQQKRKALTVNFSEATFQYEAQISSALDGFDDLPPLTQLGLSEMAKAGLQ